MGLMRRGLGVSYLRYFLLYDGGFPLFIPYELRFMRRIMLHFGALVAAHAVRRTVVVSPHTSSPFESYDRYKPSGGSHMEFCADDAVFKLAGYRKNGI